MYNGARQLAEAVESVYAQTRPPDEVIVLDDGSTDETPEILGELVAKYPLRGERQPNAGEAVSRNRLVDMARGDLIAFLDHDDLWDPRKLERQVEHIRGFDLSFTDGLDERGDGSRELRHVPGWRPEEALDRLSHEAVILTPSMAMAKRKVLVETPFEPVAPFGTDWLFYLRLAQAGKRIEHLPEPLTIRRLHEANMSAGYERWLEAGEAVFEQFGNPRCTAAWHLEVAIRSKRRADRRRARKHILAAARAHPFSIRPGWARIFA